MSEIPEDLQRLVGDLLGPPDERMSRQGYNALSLRIARAILAERLAQQERDAKIADELWKVRAASNLSPTEAARLTAQSIAFSIRSQPKNSEST